MTHTLLRLALLALLPTAAVADEWTGSGELGLAVARGNSESENFNTKLTLINESADWSHTFGLSAVRASSRIEGDFDNDGTLDQRSQLSANRYQLNASSGFKMNPRASWIGALRYENDDFAAFEHQTTFSLSFGYKLIDNEQTKLRAEVGPGFRLAKPRDQSGTESDGIFRSLVDYSQALTGNTSLVNTLLIEAGKDNRFAQNDFGVSVAMNSRLALKTGIQLRYNSEIDLGSKHTDTLTTVNLVYSLK